MNRRTGTLLALSLAAALGACGGARPAGPRVEGGRLAPCPATPNCVSSQAGDDAHRVEPLRFSGSAAAAMARLAAVVRGLPRTTVVEAGDAYLRAECRSALFRFVDDLEFLADEPAGVIHVRSASRVGRSDLGVNRRRVESVRAGWEAAGR